MKMRQVTANAFVDTQFSDPSVGHGCNPGFVTTSVGVVMIDTPMLPTYAVRWRDEIARRGEVRYLINTGYHLDHISGNYFFPGTVVSQEGIRAMLCGPLKGILLPTMDTAKVAIARAMGLGEYIVWRYQDRDPEGMKESPDLARNYRPRLPELTFSDRLTLHVGDHTFELFHLPGHTPHEVGVYVPEERVVFTGDNFTPGIQPRIDQSSPLEWVQSLKKIAAMDADFFVPGHGEVGDKKAVREFTAFLEGLIDVVRQFVKQGGTKEEAVAQISFEGQLLVRHSGVEQQRMNVTRLYEAVSNEARVQ